MKIRMLTLSAGPEGVRSAGSVYEVGPKEGDELVRLGYAELVEDDKPPSVPIVESAVIEQPEMAVLPRAKGRTGKKR